MATIDCGGSMPGDADTPKTAFVLGGGGVLGASQVGMLRALVECGIEPDLVLGTSVGAVNGAFFAAEPTLRTVEKLTEIWTSLSRGGVFAGSMASRAVTLARHRTHLHSALPLRSLLQENLPVQHIEDLPIRFECIAASIERATGRWFSEGRLVDAVAASCAVPGLLPPAPVNGEHFYDGGLVDSVPVARAIQLGAVEVFVLHVGRLEQPLRAPRWPWEVGLVAFEIARRHRFVEAMTSVPDGRCVHVLPIGHQQIPRLNLRYADARNVRERITAAYLASRERLETLRATP
jgi:NTE family protein